MILRLRYLLPAALLGMGALCAAPAPSALAAPPTPAPINDPQAGAGAVARILAVVNGDVITAADVAARARLFALSVGMAPAPEVIGRMRPQILSQLIDERLRLQEIQRRRILVNDADIAAAIREIEGRNHLPPGALRARFTAAGVDFRTLIDQVRVQIGWGDVLQQELGPQARVTDADVAEQERLVKEQTGQPEFNIGEIFISADARHAAEAQGFATTVIQQLRAGAPFPMVAAQFSQSQNALQGGDSGWVQPNQLDPAQLRVVQEMPVGAVSNPIAVPGGLSIIALRGKRQIGNDPATMLDVRQAFFPFPTRLDPSAPTAAQQEVLARAKRLSTSASSCADIESAQKAINPGRPANPGPIRLEGVPVPALRQVLGSLAVGKASQPLIADDGVAVMMVCAREQKNLGMPDRKELEMRLLNERAELASRQLMYELRRRANINQRADS